MEELARQARRVTFDEESSGALIEVLSQEYLRQFYERSPSSTQLLSDLLAIRSTVNPEQLEATHCGILHFTPDPAKFIPEATIICSAFKGVSGRDIIKSRELRGPIRTLAEQALQLIQDWITVETTHQGARLVPKTLIPPLAIREAIINALVHRKYNLPGPIKIALYEDRLEIFSPGELPGLLTTKDLGDGTTFLRNPRLVNVARKMHLVEKLGSGIRTMKEECHKAKIAQPIFSEGSQFFKVTFPFTSLANTNFNDLVLQTLEQEGIIRAAQLIKRLPISRNTATRRLNELVERGILERKGKGRGVHYLKKN